MDKEIIVGLDHGSSDGTVATFSHNEGDLFIVDEVAQIDPEVLRKVIDRVPHIPAQKWLANDTEFLEELNSRIRNGCREAPEVQDAEVVDPLALPQPLDNPE